MVSTKGEVSDVKSAFRKLSAEIQARFRKNRVKPADVAKAVEWARKTKS